MKPSVTLVDTQAAIWLTQVPAKLSRPALEAVELSRREGHLAISDVTLWEAAMLISRKRVVVGPALLDYLKFLEKRFHVLPVTPAIAERSVHFGATYPKDPSDQLIGATALVHGAPLITSDRLIRASGEVNCIW